MFLSELIGVLMLGRCDIASCFNMDEAPCLEVVSAARLLSHADAKLLHIEFTLGPTLQPYPFTCMRTGHDNLFAAL